MTFLGLMWRNLTYHARGNLAVMLGVVVGAAVLTGALLRGDWLQGSLRERTLRRLGWVDQALVTPRFFRQKLGDELRLTIGPEGRISPAILLQATMAAGEGRERKQARSVTVMGVDGSFF